MQLSTNCRHSQNGNDMTHKGTPGETPERNTARSFEPRGPKHICMALVAGALAGVLAFPAVAQSQGGEQATAVKVDAVKFEPFKQTVPVIGQFVVRQTGVVATRVRGAVGTIAVDVGDRVGTGDVLAVLVRDRLEWERNLQRAEVANYSAQVKTQQERIGLLQQELKRLESLKKSPAFSQARLDDKRQEIIVASSEVTEAEAQLRKARANLKLTEIDLRDAEIRAPYSGVVSKKHAAVGSYVDIGDPVVTLIDDDSLEIEADVPSERVDGIETGTPVDVETVTKSRYPAIVRAVIPEENPQTRTRAVRFTPVLPEGSSRPAANQSVVLYLPAGAVRDVLSVHKDAVLNRRGKRLVVVAADGKANFRPVQLGEAIGSRFVVVEGLKEGDLVVVRGNERLRPNQAIRFNGGPPEKAVEQPKEAGG